APDRVPPARGHARSHRRRRARRARGGAEAGMNLPQHVTIYEVGPRDGLQNEARQVPTADKIRMIEALIAAGVTTLEITSFVSPKWIPQLADAAEVARGIGRRDGVRM